MLKQLVYKKIPSDTTLSGEKIKAEKSFWSGLIKAKDTFFTWCKEKLRVGANPVWGEQID
jgi:hypothetical protein